MPYANRQVLSVKYDKVEAPFNMVVSNGTLSLWLFYYWMTRSGRGISFLYLDEFDAFYNYGLSEHILRYVNQKSSFQSVLTTHNVYLLDNELMRPDCYFIINDGKIASLASRTNKTIRQAHNLEKMFLGGGENLKRRRAFTLGTLPLIALDYNAKLALRKYGLKFDNSDRIVMDGR